MVSVTTEERVMMKKLISKTEHQFNTSVYQSHVGNSKNHFVMTIVM